MQSTKALVGRCIINSQTKKHILNSVSMNNLECLSKSYCGFKRTNSKFSVNSFHSLNVKINKKNSEIFIKWRKKKMTCLIDMTPNLTLAGIR